VRNVSRAVDISGGGEVSEARRDDFRAWRKASSSSKLCLLPVTVEYWLEIPLRILSMALGDPLKSTSTLSMDPSSSSKLDDVASGYGISGGGEDGGVDGGTPAASFFAGPCPN